MPKKLLLCTDLDRTLLPNGNQPESPDARNLFKRLAARPEITLAYVSGRHRSLVEDAIREYDLPEPNWVIGDVGTTLHQVTSGEWRYWSAWEKDVSTDWKGIKARALKPLFADISALQLQEESKQNDYKLSFYIAKDTDMAALKREMNRRLNLTGLSTSLIFSVDEVERIGLVDVLPALATKLHAVEFLMLNQGFDISNTVFAGDSGNDLPILTSSIPSVLVANADRLTIEQAQIQALRQNTLAAFYLAQGGFMGMNGNYSAGIVEGVVHYYPHAQMWIESV